MHRSWFLPSFMMLAALLAVGLATNHLLLTPILYWLGLSLGALGLAALCARIFKVELNIPKSAPLLIVMLALEPNAYASVKPILNMVPFTADRALAGIDHAIFGTDPWMLLQWMKPLFGYYFMGWVAAICLATLHLALSPPSPHKNRTIVTYFVIWSVAGPMIHLLFPAGGPIFYQLLGAGDRFASLQIAPDILVYRDYLWSLHQSGFSGQYAGISAMPSLHVAVATWVVFAFWRSPLFLVALAHGCLIFLLSVATGWHYAIDGIVSIGLVIGIYASIACASNLFVLVRSKSWEGNDVAPVIP